MVLRIGSSGPVVETLQRTLDAIGYDPGPIDGDYGDDTKTQVRRFQQAHGLEQDGIAGPKTLSLLGLDGDEPSPALTDITAKVTVAMVTRMFPGTLAANIERNLPLVLAALSKAHLGDRAMVLMALGTIRAECAPFLPLVEGQSEYNTRDRPFDLYDDRADLGNHGHPDGALFCGRGFVQLTGRQNYTRYQDIIGEPLVTQPDLAADPAIAARLLAQFLAEEETRLRTALDAGDLAMARKLVNGGENGVSAFIDTYQRGLTEIPEA
jgi:hypothetical protein